MSFVSDRRASLIRQRDKIIAALTVLYDQLTDASISSVKSYKFDSGDGSQSAVRRDFSEIQTQIEKLEATLARIQGELAGVGILSLKLRRKTPVNY